MSLFPGKMTVTILVAAGVAIVAAVRRSLNKPSVTVKSVPKSHESDQNKE